jgi:3D (Asp-Asp-Asp) domain-containing protein
MLQRLLSLALLGTAAFLMASCGNSGLAVIPKSQINTAQLKATQGKPARLASQGIPGPSAEVVAAAAAKPRDKHSMPVYTYSERQRMVRTTAYTCTEDDHLIYGNKNATGTPLRYTNRVRSAAADWSFYPVGTTFRIKGLPYLYVIDDYGSALTGTGTVDLYKPNKEVMNLWGRRNVEITIVQWGSFTRSAEILSHRTKHAHCAKMLANIVRQRPDLGQLAMR